MAINKQDFDLLRTFIKENCGIAVGDEKTYLIESRLAQLVAQSGARDFGEFYLKAKHDPQGVLRDKIVDAMTTNETLWFRDASPWLIWREQLLPELVADLAAARRARIRIWSAACSTGQEPYTVAMLIDEMLAGPAGRGVAPERFEIIATDISSSALFIAMAGRYNQIAMSRGLDPAYRDRYFTQQGNIWELSEKIRRRVAFKKFNLQDSLAVLGRFDVVLCRNVAIYFSDAFKRDLFARIAAALTPGGVLFLGSSESIMGYSNDFKLHEHKKAIYYKVTQEVRP